MGQDFLSVYLHSLLSRGPTCYMTKLLAHQRKKEGRFSCYLCRPDWGHSKSCVWLMFISSFSCVKPSCLAFCPFFPSFCLFNLCWQNRQLSLNQSTQHFHSSYKNAGPIDLHLERNAKMLPGLHQQTCCALSVPHKRKDQHQSPGILCAQEIVFFLFFWQQMYKNMKNSLLRVWLQKSGA